MNDTGEPLSDQVFHRFLALQHFLRRHTRQLIDERGLTPRDLSVLRYLLESESATVGQVQAFMHKSPSTTSSLISQLEEKGYVTRTRSQQDNRVVIVELTPAGAGDCRKHAAGRPAAPAAAAGQPVPGTPVRN